MMHHIWIRIVVVSLILSGNGSFAANINPRADIEAVANSKIVHISESKFLNDSELESQPILVADSTIPATNHIIYNTLATVADTALCALKFNSYNPRAPPFLAK